MTKHDSDKKILVYVPWSLVQIPVVKKLLETEAGFVSITVGPIFTSLKEKRTSRTEFITELWVECTGLYNYVTLCHRQQQWLVLASSIWSHWV